MLKRSFMIVAFIFCLSMTAYAQDNTTDTTSTSPGSTIQFYAVLCEDRAVIDLSGVLLSGHSIYYQVFSGSRGSGTALTDLRRVNTSGTYSVTETAMFNSGATLPANSIGSVYIALAPTNNASNSFYSDYADDVQDGCGTGSNTPSVSESTGQTSTSTSTGTGSSTGTSTGVTRAGQFANGTSAILSPFGGYLNPNYIPASQTEPVVQIGARPTSNRTLPRQETPGLIFAECSKYPVAEPGLVYDSDKVVVFWSWFTTTEEQMQHHIDNVNYSVTYYQTVPLPNPITRTPIRRIGGRYWVFYYSELGNLKPGDYSFEYKVSWNEQHFDGINNYGPGSGERETVHSNCFFRVLGNPEGTPVRHSNWPYGS
jgi:hypothetical protein